MDALYDELQKIRKCPGVYLSRHNLFSLFDYISGFCSGHGNIMRYNSLTGFNDYVAELYHDTHSASWATIIENHVQNNEDVFSVFYKLYDEYVDIKKEQGIPNYPPPHFLIGGLYCYQWENEKYLFIILDFQGAEYLVAVTEYDEEILNDFSILRKFSIGWELFPAMIVPAKTEKFGRLPLTGDYSHLGRRQCSDHTVIEWIANRDMWKNEGRYQLEASLSELIYSDCLSNKMSFK